MQYSETILGLFDKPQYSGRLPNNNNVYKAEVFGSLPTNFVKLYLQINKSGIIENARYFVNGCPVLIACCEITIKLILGKYVNDIQKVSYLEIADYLQVSALKLHCAIQIEEVLHVVLTKYLEKP